MNRVTRTSLAVVLATTVTLSSVRTARADTPAVMIIGLTTLALTSFGVGFQIGQATKRNDKGDDKNQDSEGGETTATTATTDSTGNTTSSTTTTDNRRMSQGGKRPGQWFAFSEQRLPLRKNTFGLAYAQIDNQADVKRTPDSIKQVTFEVTRRSFLEITRTETTGKALSIPFAIRAKTLQLTTKDIAGTKGMSSLDIFVKADGREIYHFRASVAQGQKPSFSNDMNYGALKAENNLLELSDVKKDLVVTLPQGKDKLPLEIVVTTHGVGQRL